MSPTLAVVSQSGESLSFYDIDSGEKTGHISNLIAEPHELCYDDRTNLLYVTHAYAHGWYVSHGEDGTTISIIDCTQRQVIDTIDITPYGGPHYALLDKSRNILYSSVEAGLNDAGGIIGIDLHTNKIIQAIPSGAKTHWFVMTPDGRKAYTCNKEAGFVSVLDLHQGIMIAKIELAGGCEQPGISIDGEFVYFPIPMPQKKSSDHFEFSSSSTVNENEDKDNKNENEKKEASTAKQSSIVQIISTSTNTLSTTTIIPLPSSGLTIHVDTHNRLLVGQFRLDRTTSPPQQLPGKLSIFSGPEGNFEHLATFDTELAPLTIASTTDGKWAFVANIFSGTVTVVDLEGMRVEEGKRIVVDVEHREDKGMLQGAHGMVVVP
ncbi:hypothetical protein CERZMDRAFT_96128 [Cercospora zeae-maydis SCOH1-5]|uniref:SMP-30/Gluconolactonase/LRE-like region domain-containing protein n=1 Tax=Cercospora zeae-maydis SCOH1-5 TaxID=717836 RepID=A0A6A6FKV1_9PEZI|nr:hypothetical protein CERZMDRAFT_96128 [Cercospora zeae-maydis SCOH1-5]